MSVLNKPFCKEKIIFFVDLHDEMNGMEFMPKATTSTGSRLAMIKKALGIFINSKSKMHAEHEYALGVLTDSAILLNEFTSDVDSMVFKIQELQPQGVFNTFNMNSVFESIDGLFSPPRYDDNGHPEYIVRVIFIYSRSNVCPSINNMTQYERYTKKYLHCEMHIPSPQANNNNSSSSSSNLATDISSPMTQAVIGSGMHASSSSSSSLQSQRQRQQQQPIITAPFFFFDAVYLHNKPITDVNKDKNNQPNMEALQAIFNFLISVKTTVSVSSNSNLAALSGSLSPMASQSQVFSSINQSINSNQSLQKAMQTYSYKFENAGNIQKLFTDFAILLAHPLQRREQGSQVGRLAEDGSAQVSIIPSPTTAPTPMYPTVTGLPTTAQQQQQQDVSPQYVIDTSEIKKKKKSFF